jgi:hypothetical protein
MTTNDFVTHLGVAIVTVLIAVYTLITVGFNAYSTLFIFVPVVIVLLALLGRKFPKINEWWG